jgi:predicted nucleic acid-binding protein
MIFVDSNIPMYLIGKDHPHKHDSRSILETLASEKQTLATSVEVFQEIMHRYTAIKQKQAIQPAFDLLNDLVDKVFDITKKDVFLAKDLILAYSKLSARDALHLSTMKNNNIHKIFSFDSGFDLVPNIHRIGAT